LILLILIFLLCYLIYLYKNIKQLPVQTLKPSPTPSVTPKTIKTNPPITIPTFTVKPRPITKYPLTEQAIMLSFPSSQYTTPYNQYIFNNLLVKNMSQSIVDKIPNNKDISLNCYVLYTNTFLPKVINNQVTQYTLKPVLNNIPNAYDPLNDLLYNNDPNANIKIVDKYDPNYYENPQTLPPITIINIEENKEEYDLIGAYFFLKFKKFLEETPFKDCVPIYYDSIKKIVINKDCLVAIYDKIKGHNVDDRNNFISLSETMSLDDFVPFISKFLFYGYGVNENTTQKYKNLELTC